MNKRARAHEKTKLIIIGVDALDINIVEKLGFTAIKQAQYGKIKVPFSNVSGYPRSPSVWATFLTGKEIEIEFSRGKFIDFIISHIPKGFIGRLLHTNRIFSLIQKEYPNRFDGLEGELFTDWEMIKGINVPYQNHEVNTLRQLVRLRNKLHRPGTIRKMMDIHNSRTKQIFNEIRNTDKSYDVIFAYIQTLDTLQHALHLRPNVIHKLYRTLEKEIQDIKHKYPDYIVIIVSDHGFIKGTHSHTGFYSCNHVLNPKPRNIQDFYEIVRLHLRDNKK